MTLFLKLYSADLSDYSYHFVSLVGVVETIWYQFRMHYRCTVSIVAHAFAEIINH